MPKKVYLNDMKISSDLNKVSFKSAIVNINAVSDTHGELAMANNALETMRNLSNDIFVKEGKGKKNIFAICGDWFMSGAKKGFSSNPEKPLAFFQLDILNEFINQINSIQNNSVLFVAGNHEFDGGAALFDKVCSKLNAEIIMTNLKKYKSPALIESADKILKQKIIEIEDDKNPDLKHKVLFLGISPVNMSAYKKDLQGIEFLNNSPSYQANITKNDYLKTLESCKRQIARFKRKNPNGIVVLLNHTGVGFADNLAKESNVDLVLNGHEHKNNIRNVNDTLIVEMSQNFEKMVNAKLKIDDRGKLSNIELKTYYPAKDKTDGPITELYNKLLGEDLMPKYSITTRNPNLTQLDIKFIRNKNNYLSNFVTDSVLEEIKKIRPDVDFFALNSSSIRHSLKISKKPEISNFDIINVLSGINDDEGNIVISEVTGKQILEMVLDNVLNNNIAPQKNSLIQYSGLKINKTNLLKAFVQRAPKEELINNIFDASTNEPIILNKKYKMANVIKYFNKTKNQRIKAIKDNAESLNVTVQELFKKHFETSDGNLTAKLDVRIK